MQPTEGVSIQRRSLDVEDYIDILRRHRGWIFGPFLFTLVASIVGVHLWPDSYVSEGIIKIVPQQVPQNLVQSAVFQEMTDRINAMSQTIESRGVLQTIINTYGLYPRERARLPLDDVVELMRKKIDIPPVQSAPGRQVPAFGVRFTYENRFKANQVVTDLMGRFIDENQRNRSDSSFQTAQFLKDERDRAKKQLDEIENRLTTFRMANNGRLPDQVESNMRYLQGAENQVMALNSTIARSSSDKLQLETNMKVLKDQLTVFSKEPVEVTATPQKTQRLLEAERDVENLQNNLTVTRARYTETSPDVRQAKAILAAAEKKRDDIVKEETETKKSTPTVKPVNQQQVAAIRDTENRITLLESAINVKELEIQQANKDLRAASEMMKTYRGRIESIPLGQKEFDDLLRDREQAKSKYLEMDEKLSKAQLGQEMENRKQGELLEILDPASLPQTPTEPNRPLYMALGAGVGLLLGVVIAGAREMKDTSLKNLKDVRAYTQMAILGSIPLLENDFVVRRRRRLSWLGWTTACMAAVVVSAGSVVYYYATKQ
jgi:succinoglycan biosynthesis transport protein ExoP